MAPPHFSASDLSQDWHQVVERQEAEAIAGELDRELSPDHRLYGVSVEPVAAHKRGKETVFWLPDEARWAWVHLTRSKETDARWPMTQVAEDWASVVALLREADRA